jgi:uncharacterized protein (DUF58 family)
MSSFFWTASYNVRCGSYRSKEAIPVFSQDQGPTFSRYRRIYPRRTGLFFPVPGYRRSRSKYRQQYPYLIFSLMLGLIIVSGIFSRRILAGLSANIEFPAYIFSETSVPSHVTVLNKKRYFPAIGVRFVLKNQDLPPVGKYFFYIPPFDKVSGFMPIVFPHRGVHLLQEMELRTRFPFSFLTKVRRIPLNQTIRVYPKIYRISDDVLAKFSEGILHESPYRGDSAQLLHLRDYNPLDSNKRIHWKASAKTEKFFVKEFQRDQGKDLTVYFDCYPDGNAVSQIQEKAISIVASIAHKATEKGYKATFCFPDATFEIGGSGQLVITSLLDYLAAIKTSPPKGVYRNPNNKDTVVVVIRSEAITPKAKLDHLKVQIAAVESFPMQDRLKTL